MSQLSLQNETLRNYPFLEGMYRDPYFPDPLVDKGKAILVDLCGKIERERPAGLPELYVLSHAATERFNALEREFHRNGSEIETMAREYIADDFYNIAQAYGFDADIEELIAPREW